MEHIGVILEYHNGCPSPQSSTGKLVVDMVSQAQRADKPASLKKQPLLSCKQEMIEASASWSSRSRLLRRRIRIPRLVVLAVNAVRNIKIKAVCTK
jgi:hypothetical protein